MVHAYNCRLPAKILEGEHVPLDDHFKFLPTGELHFHGLWPPLQILPNPFWSVPVGALVRGLAESSTLASLRQQLQEHLEVPAGLQRLPRGPNSAERAADFWEQGRGFGVDISVG